MKRRPAAGLAAVATVLALILAGCGTTDDDNDGNQTAKPEYNAGVGKVFNASTAKGGTLRFANPGDWDSLDPADTYYAYSWNFIRFYGRALMMFAPAPGAEGAKLIPDLAEAPGVPTDNAKTWTYKIRKGVKYEDGTPVTSKDVKYAVARSLDKNAFPNGPTYFNDSLDLQGYKSPYLDKTPNAANLKAIETPDDHTIVFKLKAPFSAFDYFAMLPATIPVPYQKDTGSKYKEHVMSTGPYMFETNELGKRFTLIRNPHWDPSTDPIRKALPNRIEVAIKVNADDIDNRLISGDLDVDIAGTGVQPGTQGRVLGDQNLRKNLDSAQVARLWYTSINIDVPPFENINCRKAVLYAVDHEGYQRAYGGSVGGDIATSMLPPLIPGAKKVDLYNFEGKKTGDVDAAKKALADCGKPTGFTTNFSYRAERPKEKATAESMQQALAKVGIQVTLKPYPQGDYFKLYAGKPDFAKANGLGLMINGWGADWPDGYGFLSQIVDSRVIRSAGNTNLGVKIPEVDAMLDKALQVTDAKEREAVWAQIDERVMREAVTIPGIWARGLLYRPPTLRNVFVSDGFQMYDYLALGVQ